jgi:hypothetical protein
MTPVVKLRLTGIWLLSEKLALGAFREQMAGDLTVFSGNPKLGYFRATAIHHQCAAWMESAARRRIRQAGDFAGNDRRTDEPWIPSRHRKLNAKY